MNHQWAIRGTETWGMADCCQITCSVQTCREDRTAKGEQRTEQCGRHPLAVSDRWEEAAQDVTAISGSRRTENTQPLVTGRKETPSQP